MPDPVVDLFRSVRLSGAVFLEAQFTAPWCIRSKVGPEDCAPFGHRPRRIIAYHYVTAGEALLKAGDSPPVKLEAGDIVLIPRNDEHVIGSRLSACAISADRLVEVAPDGKLARIVHGGGGPMTKILCGYLGHEDAFDGLIANLPRVMKISIRQAELGGWIESSFRYALQEMDSDQPGASAVLARLAELLFIQGVRRFMSENAHEPLRRLKDPFVSRAVGLIHADMARQWTTDDLAGEVALSRSAFAERFTRALGEPPMRYVARQRLAQASRRLEGTSDSVATIAFSVGFESEAAFNRSFKRAFGAPPGAWRKIRAHRAG